MEKLTLFEEYRLIERSESEVNGAWKGAHLLLFFLAFVFGAFCTFCFHMLMYLFDEKCVLFPKLLSLTSMRQNIIYEFIPDDKEIADMLPVDFLSTQWVDKSECYLPRYVPLLSGIFGLIWTAMFLMFSTGTRTLMGMQRPWRVLLPVFVFSLSMGGLCLYATIITHAGLQELCLKLGEITGSSTCTYSVNVATLAYKRRIRGVYQATRITILSAWLHTLCWLLSALLILVRVLLVVDFQLVKVSVQLKGNIDKMLQHHEQQIRTVSPDAWINNETISRSPTSTRSQSSVKVHFQKKAQTSRFVDTSSLDSKESLNSEGYMIYTCPFTQTCSEPSLVDDERDKLERIRQFSLVPKDKQFIVKILYDIIDMIDTNKSTLSYLSPSMESTISVTKPLVRQYGQQAISSKTPKRVISETAIDPDVAEQLVLEITRKLEQKTDKRISILEEASTSTAHRPTEFESVMNITSEMKHTLKDNVGGESIGKATVKRELSASNVQQRIPSLEKSKVKKSNLKNKKVQTDEIKKKTSQKVHITESRTSVFSDFYESVTEIEPKEKESEKKETKKKEKEKKD